MLSPNNRHLTQEEKYFTIFNYSIKNHCKSLRILNITINNQILKIVLENRENGQIDFIYLKNINFYNTEELEHIFNRKVKSTYSIIYT